MPDIAFPPHWPGFNPVAFTIGGLPLRWYALAYLATFVLGWWYSRALARRGGFGVDVFDIDDIAPWVMLGVIAGGRLGFVLFYMPAFYLAHPMEIPALWHGGMSFHGGLLGVLVAGYLFARSRNLPPLGCLDIIVPVIPIGLLLGRLANFINGELFGRTSDVPWGMVFPGGGPVPRHPSQLYQAFGEGLLLLVVLGLLARSERVRKRRGFLSGAFLFGYGTARLAVENFREPDAWLGFLAFGLTMGQWLSLPMLAFGLWLMLRKARPVRAPA